MLDTGDRFYSPKTVIEILTNQSNSRSQVVELQKLPISSGRVPVETTKALRNLVLKAKTSNVMPQTWGAGWRPIITGIEYQERVTTKLMRSEGLTVDPQDTRKDLIELKNVELGRRGLVPAKRGLVPANTTVLAGTVRVYHAMAMQAEHIVVPSKAIDKTESRHIAERLLIAATAFAIVVLEANDGAPMWEFARQNISRVAAAIVTTGHVVGGIEVVKWSSDTSLLWST